MAVSVALNVTPTNPTAGQKVTATYVVSGNTGTPAGAPQDIVVTAEATVGSVPYQVHATITRQGAPAVEPLPESFSVPTAQGLTFVATADPKVFEAIA